MLPLCGLYHRFGFVLISSSFVSLTVSLCLKALPESVLDETPELIVPQKILDKLLGRDELLSPQQHLEMYNSPLNISIESGKKKPTSISAQFINIKHEERTKKSCK